LSTVEGSKLRGPSPSSVSSQAGSSQAAALAAGFGRWAGWPAAVHAGCVILLALVPAVRWWPTVSETEVAIADEMQYFAAFERVAAGRSPFDEPGYLYPAAFAYAGAWSVEHLGRARTDNLLQAANLLGLALTLWCAAAWLPWSAAQRLLGGTAFILLAPQARYSVGSNNVSLAVAGMIVAGLLLVPRRPLAAGLLLGGSVALKPVAPAALGCLLFARGELGGRRNVVAAGVGIAVAAALVLLLPHSAELLGRVGGRAVLDTVSLHRLPGLFGLGVNLIWVSVLVAVAAVAVLVLRGPLGRGRFLCLATAATVAATPLVRSHTLVLLLPLEVLAVTVAARRWTAASAALPAGRRVGSWVEPVLVLLAVASLQFSVGAGTIHGQGFLLELVGGGVPALAPLALLAYLLATTDRF